MTSWLENLCSYCWLPRCNDGEHDWLTNTGDPTNIFQCRKCQLKVQLSATLNKEETQCPTSSQ